ncbi:MAG: hypothetical protein ACYCVB_17995, partial [Bacilli bacterium]
MSAERKRLKTPSGYAAEPRHGRDSTDLKRLQTSGEGDRKGAPLVVDAVHKRFVQGTQISHVLRGVSITVGPGEIV